MMLGRTTAGTSTHGSSTSSMRSPPSSSVARCSSAAAARSSAPCSACSSSRHSPTCSRRTTSRLGAGGRQGRDHRDRGAAAAALREPPRPVELARYRAHCAPAIIDRRGARVPLRRNPRMSLRGRHAAAQVHPRAGGSLLSAARARIPRLVLLGRGVPRVLGRSLRVRPRTRLTGASRHSVAGASCATPATPTASAASDRRRSRLDQRPRRQTAARVHPISRRLPSLRLAARPSHARATPRRAAHSPPAVRIRTRRCSGSVLRGRRVIRGMRSRRVTRRCRGRQGRRGDSRR